MGCKVTRGDTEQRERGWWELAFVDFLKVEAAREQEHAHMHTQTRAQCHSDTSVSPRSKGDGGVMCDTNEQVAHWYSPC